MRKLAAYGENGRRVGETHHNATIPEAIVQEIRELHEEHRWGYRRIAKHLGLRWTTVSKICRYQRRACLPADWKRPRQAKDRPAGTDQSA